MTSSMLSAERRWASSRRGGGMTVLGKVAVPKSINLPSQRLENHGLDPNVEIVPKGTLRWGSKSSSSASNAWDSSSLSPNANDGASSPSHLSARPSSGGSGTRPSTSGSDRAPELTTNAWGSNSRPLSASGTPTSNQTSQTSLRPRSAETRPGSSQLSGFAEHVTENSVAWDVARTTEKMDFHKSRMGRTSIFHSTGYNPPEDSLSQDVIATVEKSVKKYTDNLMRFLEGISSRLSHLELYCCNLDKSIGEMKSDLNHDRGEQDLKLKSLEKLIQEVNRSVQILRDKQELAETQKELAMLQLSQKESSSSSHSQSNEDRSSPSTTDPKRTENASDANNQQLAFALPHQIATQPQPAATPAQAPTPNVTQATQQPAYYMASAPLPDPQAAAVAAQLPQNQYMPSDQQYRTQQLQDMSQLAPQPTPSQVTPPPSMQQFSQPQQQQWPQQAQPPQPPSMQPQMRPPSSAVYPPYQPSQPTNPPPPPLTETLPNSMPMQMPYSGGSSRADSMPYGYGGTGRTVPQQRPPPQQIKGSFPAQPGDVYGSSGTHPTHPPPGNAYMMYDDEGGRTHHPPPRPPHFAQAGYPPTTGHNLMVRNPSQSQFVRNNPYNELIEKLMSMGFRGNHVASVVQRMEESGLPIDFNSVLDGLNVPSSVGPQRGWSG